MAAHAVESVEPTTLQLEADEQGSSVQGDLRAWRRGRASADAG